MKLVGYKTFYSREKDKDFFVANCTYSFREGEGVGTEIYGQFLDKDVYEQLKPDMIGKEIDFDRHQEGRYSKITGIKIIK